MLLCLDPNRARATEVFFDYFVVHEYATFHIPCLPTHPDVRVQIAKVKTKAVPWEYEGEQSRTKWPVSAKPTRGGGENVIPWRKQFVDTKTRRRGEEGEYHLFIMPARPL